VDLFASLQDKLITVLENVQPLLLLQSPQELLDVLLAQHLLYFRHLATLTLHLLYRLRFPTFADALVQRTVDLQ
jgi:hypothetical protein